MYHLLKPRILLPTGLITLLFSLFITLSMQANVAASPVSGPLPLATVPTPAPLVSLSIAHSGNNAHLSWTDSFPSLPHTIYRGNIPFFTPTNDTVLITLPAGTASYIDTTSGIGNLGVNHYYIVAAVDGATTIPSNWVGEIDYALNTNNATYSLIGIPFASPSPNDAASLAAQIGNVYNVLGWDQTTQTFKTFTTPNIGNFSFVTGDAIFVQVASGVASSTNIVGRLNVPAYAIKPGGYSFISMPLYCDELSNASSTANDITHVANLLRWLHATQTFQPFTPPTVGDFALSVGDPLIVDLNSSGSSSWPTFASACQ